MKKMIRMYFSGAAMTVALLMAYIPGVCVPAAGDAGPQMRHFGIPFKPDPPPAIDGQLNEWGLVPNAQTLDTKAHVVFGGNNWKSTQNLSGKVWLAWRDEYLYLAADVQDDRVVQTFQGMDLYKGDHIELYLDVTPDSDEARETFGQGQIHFGFSPGNFQRTNDALFDRAPEAVVFAPHSANVDGILLAAQKTAGGYALEAAIPWPVIRKLANTAGATAAAGTSLGIEVAISDTDSAGAGQERMMTLLTTPWQPQFRPRLMPSALAGTDGVAPAVARGFSVFDEFTLKAGEKKTIAFDAPATPEGREAILGFLARADWKEPGGYNYMVRMKLNGTLLGSAQLYNKKLQEERVDGAFLAMMAGDRLTVPYSPDFDAVDQHPNYALKRLKAAATELQVSKLLREGENVLEIENAASEGDGAVNLILDNAHLEYRAPKSEQVRRPAPTGALPIVQPDSTRKTPYLLTTEGGEMRVVIGGARFPVVSQFSSPDGKWQKGGNVTYFSHERQIEKRDEVIIVRDTFTNLTDQNLPLMQRYQVMAPDGLRKVWLAGTSPSSLNAVATSPGNPTAYGVTEGAGVGIMAWDDVLQVHVTNFSGEDFVGLADNHLVLRPKARHTTEWVIVPTAKPNYWTFVNAARRFRDVNFRIDGAFGFFFPGEGRPSTGWSDQQVRDFFGLKNVRLASPSPSRQYNGRHPHGTSFFKVDWTQYKNEIARFRKLVAKDTRFISYFHCFLDADEDAPVRYPDARVLRPDGAQADYGVSWLRNFVPTETNAFGRDVARMVDVITAPYPKGFGCEGIYWDELEYSSSQYHYDDFDKPKSGLPWDGVSADIDPQTKKIMRLKSSVTLMSQPYRLGIARRVLARGPLWGNGAPHTRSMMQLHFPRFVETGSISNCVQTHLYTPVALGDHLTERTEVDAYRWMVRALDYGCVYAWYSDTIMPTHPTLTSYMFPITPLELHEGTIIGRERIVTNRSGLFGWDDDSGHEVHVFNDTGVEVQNFKAPLVRKNGKTFTELRLAEDWSAAIVRK